MEDEILEEIHKFPYPIQKMLVKEACAVTDRLTKGKNAPGLTSLDCHCRFYHQYMLPCKHIFHEHAYGTTKLLTADTWRIFQDMFEESGFEVYECRQLVIVEEFEQTEEEKRAGNRRLFVNELMERVRNKYFSMEERGSAGQVEAFIEKLEASLDPFINDFDKQ